MKTNKKTALAIMVDVQDSSHRFYELRIRDPKDSRPVEDHTNSILGHFRETRRLQALRVGYAELEVKGDIESMAREFAEKYDALSVVCSSHYYQGIVDFDTKEAREGARRLLQDHNFILD